MERDIASLVRLIGTLSETEHPRNLTAYITLCLCHIKRRCNLFFLARQGEPILGEELRIYWTNWRSWPAMQDCKR